MGMKGCAEDGVRSEKLPIHKGRFGAEEGNLGGEVRCFLQVMLIRM